MIFKKLLEPKNLISSFVAGSLLVMMLCLSATSLIFTIVFISKESQRVEVAQKQVLQFFLFQHFAFSEEMWTRNVESIALRVSKIAEQLGEAEFELHITDEAGTCLLHYGSKGAIETCKTPAELENFIAHTDPKKIPQAALTYDEKMKRNIFMVPLAIGDITKGYLYTELTDPYHFYRGNILSFATMTFLPAILVILFIWGIWLVISNRILLKPYLANVLEMQNRDAIARMAQQVAHDLKSPIATLLNVTSGLKQIPHERMMLMRGAVSSIRDIANGLLARKNPATKEICSQPDVRTSDYLLFSLLDSVVAARREEYKERKGLFIDYSPSAEAHGLFVHVNAVEFKRVISNLINNAAEAIENVGEVIISVTHAGRSVTIEIKDNGKGIPKAVLPKLGERGFSFGKQAGTGLGLFHAKETVKFWKGKLAIESSEGEGTLIRIVLPKAETPSWFASEICIPESLDRIVILDDDPSIHDIWSQRLRNIGLYTQVSSFFSSGEFTHWLQTQAHGEFQRTIFLMDYDLKERSQTGLDLIAKYSLSACSILITGHYEDSAVLDRSIKMQVRILPKELMGFVPFSNVRSGETFGFSVTN